MPGYNVINCLHVQVVRLPLAALGFPAPAPSNSGDTQDSQDQARAPAAPSARGGRYKIFFLYFS